MVQKNQSFWNKTGDNIFYPPLRKNFESEILILGGGITGVTCAYCLAREGAKPVLIEAGGLCDGTTGNTTGKVTIQHGAIYAGLLKKHGWRFARLYAESQAAALEFVAEQVAKHSIGCQFERNTAYLYASDEEQQDVIEAEYEASLKLKLDVDLQENPGFPEGNLLMVGLKNQAVLHPVRYVSALAAAAVSLGASIHCGTKALRLEDGDVKTVYCENDVVIRTKHLVMATQYPFYDGPNLFFTRLYPKRSYAIAVKTAGQWPDGSYISAGDPTRSVRSHRENAGRILIVAGENHPTGRGEEDMLLHFDALEEFAHRIAGAGEILARWSAQDYDTPDQVPYIGRVSDHSDIYVAAGYKKWGLSSGTLAGEMIAELIGKGTCRYEEIYSKKRFDYASSLGRTISGVFVPVGELIKSKLEMTESVRNLQPGEGRVINYEGHKAGIYRDYNDDVTILDITCTHMSTELNFNSAEKTWDCPAHGGRFSTRGKLLEGPPKHDLKLYYNGKFSDLAVK